jgi:hypothetical protein
MRLQQHPAVLIQAGNDNCCSAEMRVNQSYRNSFCSSNRYVCGVQWPGVSTALLAPAADIRQISQHTPSSSSRMPWLAGEHPGLGACRGNQATPVWYTCRASYLAALLSCCAAVVLCCSCLRTPQSPFSLPLCMTQVDLIYPLAVDQRLQQ